MEFNLQNPPDLKTRIKTEARRLGFFSSGVASVDSPPDDGFLSQWLAEGRHGDMTYLLRQDAKRRDPRLILAEAHSVLVLGMNYYPKAVPSGRDPLKGRISRYALGEDYHRVVLERLRALLRFIQAMEPAASGVCCVDTGPVMEKSWGAQAGLGWIGKHTCLISRDLGSWFFLGVILLDIPLEPDARQKNFCGTCRRCIDACPTGAIIAPHVLDARICLSYLTIEYRGSIPRPLRHLVGNRIFGCDDCQEACPWNRFARVTAEGRFSSENELRAPDLISFAEITEQEFKLRFRNSPIYRATRDGFVRNILLALGNSGQTEVVPVLEKAFQNPSIPVKVAALWALDRVSQADAVRIARTGFNETDPLVLEEIKTILVRN